MATERTAGQLLTAAIHAVTEQVDAMADADWTRPSPCEGWNAHQLLDHVTDTLVGIQGALAGKGYRASKYGDAGRTATPAEAVAKWHEQASSALPVAQTMNPEQQVEGPMGAGPAREALKIPTHDLTVHAWDLAASAGRDWEADPDLLADLDRLVRNTPPEFMRRPGLFGPEVEAPADAGPTERLMAFLGRRRP